MVVILLWYTVWKFVNIRVKPGKTICWNGTFFSIAVPNGLGEEGFLSTSIIFTDIQRRIGIATTLIWRTPLNISCPLPYTMEWTHTIYLRTQIHIWKGRVGTAQVSILVIIYESDQQWRPDKRLTETYVLNYRRYSCMT